MCTIGSAFRSRRTRLLDRRVTPASRTALAAGLKAVAGARSRNPVAYVTRLAFRRTSGRAIPAARRRGSNGGLAGDEAGGAIAGEVVAGPLQQYQQAVLKLREIHQ